MLAEKKRFRATEWFVLLLRLTCVTSIAGITYFFVEIFFGMNVLDELIMNRSNFFWSATLSIRMALVSAWSPCNNVILSMADQYLLIDGTDCHLLPNKSQNKHNHNESTNPNITTPSFMTINNEDNDSDWIMLTLKEVIFLNRETIL